MEIKNTDVKQEAPSTDVPQEKENSTVTASEGEKTPEAKVDKNVYESVREGLRKERAQNKEKNQMIKELEGRLAKLESQPGDSESDDEPRDSRITKIEAEIEVNRLVNSDKFVKDNLDLVQERMEENPHLTVKDAVREVKADFFDRIERELVSEKEKPPKQLTTKGTPVTDVDSTGDRIKDALEGRIENANPYQLEAYKRIKEKYKK